MSSGFARTLIHLLFRLIARVRIVGMDRVPPSGAYIIAANHVGRLDAALVYHILNRRDVVMMVAEKYRKYAVFRWFVRQLDAVWIDRFQADYGALRTVLQRLKQGAVLVMAPEGTRSKSGKLIQARPGAGFLAAKAGVPILPVALIGTADSEVVANLKKLKKIDIEVRVGEPFHVALEKGTDRDAALQAATDEIMCRIAALLPQSERGYYANHPRLKELVAQH
ncbi:MAG: 1-acyl-sn-glycerol-3-phosphate acyltransferase [Chloroflexi bacterium]|jgi:1-acyl-sn-glycerol-3-phosphate acyltransferase|nr:1-acyl-sn-glycerol-3-phosphate acyltransferase [Chloroflexota bacterium]